MAAPAGRWTLLPRTDERLAFTNFVLLFALPLLLYAAHLYRAAGNYDLVLPVQADHALAVRVFLNLGAGYYEQADPPSVVLPASPERPLAARFEVPAGRLVGLGLHFDRAPGATIHLGPATLYARRGDGSPVATLPLRGLRALKDIPRLAPEAEGATVVIGPRPDDPTAEINLARIIPLPFDTAGLVSGIALGLIPYLGLVFGALLLWRRLARRAGFRERMTRYRAGLERAYAWTGRTVRARPVAALWLAAALGVTASCYPVIFCGQSFVGTGISGCVLYDRMPTLPGNPETPGEDTQGGDTSASIVQSIPYALIERRALLHDGEFPLWNRYNAAAGPLLGQGQSMIGDPLQFMVILLGANSGAWDLKFLLARLLFAAGIGLAVRAATGRTAAAMGLAFSACFSGFFVYRFNHPAYFGLCYSPWILYAWLEIARTPETRKTLHWVGLLLLANWTEFCSGTVKEACMLIAALNATGLLVFLFSDARPTLGSKARTLGALAWAGVCFVLVSAPLWHTLLDAITHSWSDYIQPRAWQLQPGLLLGVFDDIFYRQFNRNERLLDPAANFVVLVGVAFAVVSLRALIKRRPFAAVGLGALLPLALVYGAVPADWIKAVPFLGNVTHIDNTFSCVLIVHLFVLAGGGLERCRERFRSPEWGVDLALAAALVAVLFAAYLGLTGAEQRSDFNPLEKLGAIRLSAFFQPYVFSLLAAFVALPLLARRLWWDRGACAAGVVPWIALCLGAMLWRGGQQLHAVVGLDRYVSHPPARVDLLGRSPAVERLLARQRQEPGRCLGFGDNLVSGFMGVYGLEAPSGPDALQNRYYHAMLVDSQLPMMWHWRLVTNRQLATAVRGFYDLLNVRFYADYPFGPAPTPLPGTHLLGRYDLDLYESDTVWPRAFFTDALTVVDGDKRLFALLGEGDGRPFAAVPPEALAGTDGGALRTLLRGGRRRRDAHGRPGHRLPAGQPHDGVPRPRDRAGRGGVARSIPGPDQRPGGDQRAARVVFPPERGVRGRLPAGGGGL